MKKVILLFIVLGLLLPAALADEFYSVIVVTDEAKECREYTPATRDEYYTFPEGWYEYDSKPLIWSIQTFEEECTQTGYKYAGRLKDVPGGELRYIRDGESYEDYIAGIQSGDITEDLPDDITDTKNDSLIPGVILAGLFMAAIVLFGKFTSKK